MTETLITTGIDALTAEADPSGGWRVRFRSAHAGLHHQLYVNGRLADATDTPAQRDFHVDAVAPAVVAVAAVAAERRWDDLSAELPTEAQTPSWIYRPRVVRSTDLAVGDVVEILGDRATGGPVDDAPLASAAAWPAWVPRWAFGQDAFGRGAFGWDGSLAPGLGEGAFGAGPFGFGADVIDLPAELTEEGTHAIVIRTRSLDGTFTDAPQPPATSAPPPAPPQSLSVEDYDPDTNTLTVQWSSNPDHDGT